MTPTPITVPLTNPGVPVTFILNGTGELEVKSVVATFDGTGAGGEFDAVCSVYTQDDKLISRTKPATSIAAGASAVVTFAPFLRKPASAAAAGTFDFCSVARTTPQTIGNGGGAVAIDLNNGVQGGTQFNFAGPPGTTGVEILNPGLYSVVFDGLWNTPGGGLQRVSSFATGPGLEAAQVDAWYGCDYNLSLAPFTAAAWFRVLPAGTVTLTPTINNSGIADISLRFFEMYVVRLGDYTAP